jgi:shikimate dehydrogenase
MRNYPYPNPQTKLCFSVSSPNSKNKAMLMHNAGFDELDLNFQYLVIDTTNLELATDAMRAFNYCGFSIGFPNKQEIVRFLDEVDDDVKKIGACNTVFNRDGKLFGYNSDWVGALNCINSRTSLEGKKAVVLGAGGTSRAIVYGLKKYGARVVILNRDLDRAGQLAKEFSCDFGSINDEKYFKDYDVLINATPVGSRGVEACNCNLCRFLGLSNDRSEFTPIFSDFSEDKLALDVVFQRNETEFTIAARKHNHNVIHGHEMLVEQGAFQFKLFTGIDAPKDVMYSKLKQYLD